MSRQALITGSVIRAGEETYTIKDLLGSGGSALIYSATCECKGVTSDVAVKELYPSSGFVRTETDGNIVPADAAYEGLYKTFKRQMNERERSLGSKAAGTNYQVIAFSKILTGVSLQLPGCPAGKVDNLYGVMADARKLGTNLSDWIGQLRRARNAGTPDSVFMVEVAEKMEAAAAAYALLHQDGILHCDCSVGNLTVLGEFTDDPERRGKASMAILDFGGSWMLSDGRVLIAENDLIYTTASYCAPEIVDKIWGESIALTPAVDVWSLGIVFLEMLSGFLEGWGKDINVTDYLVRHPWDAKLPDDVECSLPVRTLANEILQKCLAEEPSQRYQNGSELRDAFHRLLLLVRNQPIDRWSLWDAALNQRRCGPSSFFKSTFESDEAPELCGYDLDINASLNGGEPENAATLLQRLFAPGSPRRCVYFYGPSGCGKSFAVAKLIKTLDASGRLIPLHINLGDKLERETVRSNEDAENFIIDALCRDLFRDDPEYAGIMLRRMMERECESPQLLIVADDINNLSPTNYEFFRAALENMSRMPGVSILVCGHAERGPFADVMKAEGLTLDQQGCAIDFMVEKWPYEARRAFFSNITDAFFLNLEKKQGLMGLPFYFMKLLENIHAIFAKDPQKAVAPDFLNSVFDDLFDAYIGNRLESIHKGSRKVLVCKALSAMSMKRRASRQDVYDWVWNALEDREKKGRDASDIGAEILNLCVDDLKIMEPLGEDEASSAYFRFTHDCFRDYFASERIADCVSKAKTIGDLAPIATSWSLEVCKRCRILYDARFNDESALDYGSVSRMLGLMEAAQTEEEENKARKVLANLLAFNENLFGRDDAWFDRDNLSDLLDASGKDDPEYFVFRIISLATKLDVGAYDGLLKGLRLFAEQKSAGCDEFTLGIFRQGCRKRAETIMNPYSALADFFRSRDSAVAWRLVLKD